MTAAATTLVMDGRCTLAEMKEYGGWVRSSNSRPLPVFFIYCGGSRIGNRIYLDARTGRIYQ